MEAAANMLPCASRATIPSPILLPGANVESPFTFTFSGGGGSQRERRAHVATAFPSRLGSTFCCNNAAYSKVWFTVQRLLVKTIALRLHQIDQAKVNTWSITI